MIKKIKCISVIISLVLFFTGCSFKTRTSTIVVQKTEHGKISANIYKENQVTINVNPEEGYKLLQNSLTVSEHNKKYTPQEMKINKISETEYTFDLKFYEDMDCTYYIAGEFIPENQKETYSEKKSYSIEYSSIYSKISNAPKTAKEGEKVIFEVDLYYNSYSIKTDDVKITGEDGASYPVTFEGFNISGNYLYSFSMPSQNVSVKIEEYDARSKNGTYKVNLMPVKNGKITADQETYSYGTSVSINVTPDSGYKIKENSFIVFKDKKIITSKYEFSMPPHEVNVYVEFIKE